jgi:hypothetical protein
MSVPDNSVFSLQNVRTELGLGATTSLVACFAAAVDTLFDSRYMGSKNSLYNFRNYGIDSTSVFILNIKTRPWFIGAGLPSEKYNLVEFIYTTGASFPASQIENITMGVYNDDGGFWLYGLYADNITIYNTSRPLKATFLATHYEFVAMPEANLHFQIVPNMYFKSLHANLTRDPIQPYRYNMPFTRVNSASVTLSLDAAVLYFNTLGNPITTNQFNITANGDWYITCPAWLSLNKYYGTGNDTITITITTPGSSGDISVYKMTNAAPSVCQVRYTSDTVSCSPTELYFNLDGTPQTVNYTTITSSGNWTASLIDTGDGTDWLSCTSGGSTGQNCTVTVGSTDSGRQCIVRFTVGVITADCNIRQQ